MPRHKLTKAHQIKGGKEGAKAMKRYYTKQRALGHIITQEDCREINEACHRFWAKRGGMPPLKEEKEELH